MRWLALFFMIPTNHKRTKRRNLTRWMENRQRRLFWKNKTLPDATITERINQLGKQIVANNRHEPTPAE
jgi:hypothetical protein